MKKPNKKEYSMPKLCILLIAIFVLLNYLDRSIIGFVAEPISKLLSIDHTQFGILISSFFIGAMISNIISGYLCDKVNNKYIWLTSGLIWSSALIGQAFAHNETSFIILRLIMGFGEGFIFPLINRLIKNKNYKNGCTITGILTLGIPLSNVVAGPIFPTLITHYKWSGAFIISGSITAAITIAIWFFCGKETTSHQAENNKAICFNKVFNSNLKKSYAAIFCYGIILLLYIGWLPSILIKKLSINLEDAGIISSIPWISATISILLGSYCLQKLYDKNKSIKSSFIKPLAMSLTASGICLFLTSIARTEIEFITLIAINLSCLMFSNTSIFMVARESAGEHVGLATGIQAFFFLLACIIIGPLTGFIIDITKSYNDVLYIVSALCIITSVIIYRQKAYKMEISYGK